MQNVHFYLKKAEEATGLSLIYLQSKFDGTRLVYSFDEQIEPAKWNKKRERAKDNNKKAVKNVELLNQLLNNLEKLVQRSYLEYKADENKNVDAKTYIKARLDQFINKKPQVEGLFGLLDKMISGSIGDKKSKATITTYETAKKHLRDFERQMKYRVDFDTVNLEFRDKYKKFLEGDRLATRTKGGKTSKIKVKGMAPNSVYKEIKNIRTIMNLAAEHGLTKNADHKKKKFAVKQVETDSVYLTDKELREFFEFDLSDDNTLEQTRDLFVFSSYVGLRYSDTARLRPSNFIQMDGDWYISIITQKTGAPVIISCNDIVLKIREKYKDAPTRLPHAISNQKFNQYIKDAAEKAGLIETKRLVSDLEKPLHKAISSHTARRSFATNALLSGMDSRLIMAVTGHKTEVSFNKYIKITREQSAKLMNEHNKARSKGV